MNSIEQFYPSTRKEWRKWLKKNHTEIDSIWVLFYRKSSDKSSISWSEAVDEALCFGWIDSKKVKIDHESYQQYFCKRKPDSGWSKINKNKVKKLIDTKLMTKAGYASIETAKQNGSWTLYDALERLEIPEDLQVEFERYPGTEAIFMALSKSEKKFKLSGLVLAKTQKTRNKRIAEIINELTSSK